ncbi:TPA: alanine racemase [Enterobacter cloacae]|nr:alanine racemase [Enterobacter cloacae]
MPIIAIQGAICSGHEGFPPRPAVAGEPFFTVNGVPALVDGMPFDKHSDENSTHDGVAISSRPWFTINLMGVVCMGDPVSCGSVVASGDPLIFII